MNKIRVVHCLGKLNAGGAETLVMNIFRHIDRNMYQFDFLLFNDTKGFYDEEVKSLGANLYYTGNIKRVGIRKYLKELISFFSSHDIDVVHSHMDWQGGFIAYAAYKAGIKKIVIHSHANQKMFDVDLLHHFLIEFNKYLIKKYATHCISCSKEAGESLFKKDFDILRNGIDLNRFLYPNQEMIKKLKDELNISDTDIILGNVGSLSENKNQLFLINILNKLISINKNYKLILVGDGPVRKEIEQKIEEMNLQANVILTGVRKEIPEIMHLFDLFLFPSKYEGLGIVAIEAQASQRYCLVSENVPHLIDLNINLVDFLPLNQQLWIDKILNYKKSNDKNINDKIINSKFNIEKTCESLIKVYR